MDVCEKDVADENVDPGVVTSFPADILVSKVRRPLTEAYKYKVAMSHLQPIVEKLKSCGSQRFEELLREVDAFADRIMNAPSGWPQESLVDSPSQPNGDEMEADTSDGVVRCQIREEGNVFVAQWGSDQDPSHGNALPLPMASHHSRRQGHQLRHAVPVVEKTYQEWNEGRTASSQP
nr:unnamed protein product [Spirometra erinaceieuropaei]